MSKKPNDLDDTAADRALADAWVPRSPRRTDAAFARSVASGVADRKRAGRLGLSLSLAAATAGAVVLALTLPAASTGEPASNGEPASKTASATTGDNTRFALDLRATAADFEEHSATDLDDQALLALASQASEGLAFNVDSTADSGFDFAAFDLIDADLDETAEANADTEDDFDPSTGELLASVGEDLDDDTLLAMADLFAVPPNSPYQF